MQCLVLPRKAGQLISSPSGQMQLLSLFSHYTPHIAGTHRPLTNAAVSLQVVGVRRGWGITAAVWSKGQTCQLSVPAVLIVSQCGLDPPTESARLGALEEMLTPGPKPYLYSLKTLRTHPCFPKPSRGFGAPKSWGITHYAVQLPTSLVSHSLRILSFITLSETGGAAGVCVCVCSDS